MRSGCGLWTATLALMLSGFVMTCVSAQAETAKLAIPEDPEADSQAAMKFTTRDPRIDKSQKGGSAWGMWDIGRPHPMQGKGEFGDHDPIGVAAGKLIRTDCSVYWDDPDNHKILCFSTQASLIYFLAAPKTNETRAEKRWQDLSKKPAS